MPMFPNSKVPRAKRTDTSRQGVPSVSWFAVLVEAYCRFSIGPAATRRGRRIDTSDDFIVKSRRRDDEPLLFQLSRRQFSTCRLYMYAPNESLMRVNLFDCGLMSRRLPMLERWRRLAVARFGKTYTHLQTHDCRRNVFVREAFQGRLG